VERPLGSGFLLLTFLFGAAGSTAAQTVIDPNFVEFTASPDHDRLDQNGVAVVQRYDLFLHVVGTITPARVVALGKPTPAAAGTIRLGLTALLTPLPVGGTTYEVRIAAVGPGGSAASTASNGFTFQGPCTYAVSPVNRSIGSVGASSSFSVTAPAGCAWTAAESTPWITVTGGATGTGNGTVAFTVAPNATMTARDAAITIAGQARTVSQAASSCTYTVSPPSQTVGGRGGSVSFAVTAPAGCGWSASEGSSWVSIASGGTGTGAGTVTFTVASYTGTQTRTASATIGGRAVTISQRLAARPQAPTGMRVVR
jgi:hypothetical protein